MKKIILDCDTGEDDALAILVALANKLPMDYIVTSFGNTTLENSTANTANVLGLAGNSSIKVVPFSKTSLKPHPIEPQVSAADVIGKNGLCNTVIPATSYNNILDLSEDEALDKLLDILKLQKSTDYIITGPCTNFAKVCRKLGNEIKQCVHAVYIMGAAIHTAGNSGPINPKTGQQVAEFNFYCDPHAANVVLKAGLPIYLVTWDITQGITVPYARITNFQGVTDAGKFVVEMMHNFFIYYGLGLGRSFELNDPITVLAQMGWGTYKKKKIKVLTAKNKYGMTVVAEDGNPVFYFMSSKAEIEKMVQKTLADVGVTAGG